MDKSTSVARIAQRWTVRSSAFTTTTPHTPATAATPLPATPSSSSSLPVVDLAQRFFLLAHPSSPLTPQSWAIIGVLAASAMLAFPEASLAAADAVTGHHPHATTATANVVVTGIAENTDFWANVLRYVSYFFSVLLGTVYVALKPIAELLKRPTTAVLVLVAGAALYFFVSTTVGAMLGLNDLVEYEPSSIVTPAV